MEIGNEVAVIALESRHRYDSISSAARLMGATINNIRDSLECRTKSTRGYHMVYAEKSRNDRYSRYFPKKDHQAFMQDYELFLKNALDEKTLYQRYDISSKEVLRSKRRLARIERWYDLYHRVESMYNQAGMTHAQISEELGKSESYISRLLDPLYSSDMLEEHDIMHGNLERWNL